MTLLETSKKIVSDRQDGRGGKSAFEVNRRSVLASLSIGRAGLIKFCADMDLSPPVHKEPYNAHLKNIETASVETAKNVMQNAADRLISLTESEEPDNIEEEDGYKIAKVAISVDGTWQRRGHSSKIGVVFVISIRTGEVLDYEVLSMICGECKAREKIDQESDIYKEWWNKHKNNCSINFEGSSGEMETKGAIKIFLRSIKTRHLKYTLMASDGDTGCYGAVSEAVKKEYSDSYVVQKEECVGHVQKRMGTNFREYKRKRKGRKLADGKVIGGAGRLTDKAIDKIQNYYGKAIRSNKGDLQGMKKSISAIFNHIIRDDNKPLTEHHGHCPKGKETWCKYWNDQINKSNEYNDKKRLPCVFRKELEPLFTRLSDDDLLKRCLMGITQNQNEAINGMLWSRCSKTIFCDKQKVVIATCQTICEFNTGAASRATTMKLCKVKPGANMVEALKKQDTKRIMDAARKVSKKYKIRRRKLRSDKKQNQTKPVLAIFLGHSAFLLSLMLTSKNLKENKLKTKIPKLNQKKQNWNC